MESALGNTKQKAQYRIAGRMYCEVSEGHRTTFVVGAMDMLCVAYLYAATEHRTRIDAMIRYAGNYESDALRQKFDEYMRADPKRQEMGGAGCFFAALNEWCGFDK